jgi:hypothetical protein
MMLATIQRSDGAWFIERGVDGPVFGERVERAHLDMSEAESVAHVLLTTSTDDLVIIAEDF